MTLQDLLDKFDTPLEAAQVAKLGRTAAWHWFAEDERRKLPSVRTIVYWADYFGLSNDDLGSVIRDQSAIREKLHEEYLLNQEVKKLKERKEAIERNQLRRKEKIEAARKKYQAKRDEKLENETDWEDKERILELKRIETLLQEHIE
jgi:hypothetical protein